jgi:hypothetical protein
VQSPKVKTNGYCTVGSKLKSKRAIILPAIGEVKYRWLWGKKKMPGAEDRTHTQTAAAICKKLRVQAYASTSSYQWVQSNSKATKLVSFIKGLV